MPILYKYKFVWKAPKDAERPFETKFMYATNVKDAKKDFKKSFGVDPDTLPEIRITRFPS